MRCLIYFECNEDGYLNLIEIKGENIMKNYSIINVGGEARAELHDALALTGAEVSINILPAGVGVPFVHSHKDNEEIYGILSGCGKVIIDEKEVLLKAGDWLRISPAAKRQFFSSKDSEIKYICIQVKQNSLASYTAEDAVIGD